MKKDKQLGGTRIPLPRPGVVHKDKSKYDRAQDERMWKQIQDLEREKSKERPNETVS